MNPKRLGLNNRVGLIKKLKNHMAFEGKKKNFFFSD